MKVTLTMSTDETNIGENAKICYATKALDNGGKDITETLVHGHSHLAALRFAYATLYVEGISVACQNQIVRSSHLDFMVQSKRYVNADKGEFEFIMPEGLDSLQQAIMETSYFSAMHAYTLLIDSGAKKEDARAVLPANTSTKMNITGNLQGWWDFFVLRLNSHAQTEVRNVAKAIYKELSGVYPHVFTNELYERLTNG